MPAKRIPTRAHDTRREAKETIGVAPIGPPQLNDQVRYWGNIWHGVWQRLERRFPPAAYAIALSLKSHGFRVRELRSWDTGGNPLAAKRVLSPQLPSVPSQSDCVKAQKFASTVEIPELRGRGKNPKARDAEVVWIYLAAKPAKGNSEQTPHQIAVSRTADLLSLGHATVETMLKRGRKAWGYDHWRRFANPASGVALRGFVSLAYGGRWTD